MPKEIMIETQAFYAQSVIILWHILKKSLKGISTNAASSLELNKPPYS